MFVLEFLRRETDNTYLIAGTWLTTLEGIARVVGIAMCAVLLFGVALAVVDRRKARHVSVDEHEEESVTTQEGTVRHVRDTHSEADG